MKNSSPVTEKLEKRCTIGSDTGVAGSPSKRPLSKMPRDLGPYTDLVEIYKNDKVIVLMRKTQRQVEFRK
ncbi:hypothetical protein C5167_002663 [Papaver somniferum]|uniref:Uncharacterized protein n=1 Tax=Papaver somniferum TaxID=3469 RepID=A0A4Y7KW36_PAPSO|nr:hypothetical protein C5167_002663 [Papaver somniferum]